MKALESDKLLLIPCTEEILSRAIQGDNALAEFIGYQVTPGWTEFGVEALGYALQKLRESDSEAGWWTHFPILRSENTLIGSGGYAGQPNEEGIVEIGYEIAPKYRKQGLATDMVRILVSHAFGQKRVKKIIAHTLGEENASTAVLAKNGFIRTEEFRDPEEGKVWKWELNRSNLDR